MDRKPRKGTTEFLVLLKYPHDSLWNLLHFKSAAAVLMLIHGHFTQSCRAFSSCPSEPRCWPGVCSALSLCVAAVGVCWLSLCARTTAAQAARAERILWPCDTSWQTWWWKIFNQEVRIVSSPGLCSSSRRLKIDPWQHSSRDVSF